MFKLEKYEHCILTVLNFLNTWFLILKTHFHNDVLSVFSIFMKYYIRVKIMRYKELGDISILNAGVGELRKV